MVKIEYCKSDLKICLKIPESVYVNNYNKIHTLLSGVLDNLSENTIQKQETEMSNSMPLRGINGDKGFNVRERIPNSINEDTIKIQQPKIEKALVRCPQCGQGFAAIVVNDAAIDKEKRLLVKKEDEFKVTNVVIKSDEELEGMLYHGTHRLPGENGENLLDYYDDIINNAQVVEEEKDYFVDMNTTLLCPCCRSTNKFYAWKNAYENPEEKFEYSNICDICGGEVEMFVNNEGTHYQCVACKTVKGENKK